MLDLRLTPEIRRIKRGLPGFLMREARYAGQLVNREVAKRTPIGRRIDPESGVDRGPTGTLRRGWKQLPIRREGNTYTCGTRNRVSYCQAVNDGTKERIIEPRAERKAQAEARGKTVALRFWTSGDELLRGHVVHPATRGRYMIELGLNAAEREYSSQAPARLQAFLDGRER